MLIRNLLPVLLTWGSLSGLYLVLTGQASTDEIVAALCSGAAASALSVAVREGAGHRFGVRPKIWFVPAVKAVAAVPKEVLLVGWGLIRPKVPAGRYESMPFPAEESQRAIQVLTTSLAPNRYVVGIAESSRALLHRFVGGRA